jgi:hypothetical protein
VKIRKATEILRWELILKIMERLEKANDHGSIENKTCNLLTAICDVQLTICDYLQRIMKNNGLWGQPALTSFAGNTTDWTNVAVSTVMYSIR